MTKRVWEIVVVVAVVALIVNFLGGETSESETSPSSTPAATARPSQATALPSGSAVLDESYVVGEWECTFPPALDLNLRFTEEGRIHLAYDKSQYRNGNYTLRHRRGSLWELDLRADDRRTTRTLVRFFPPDKLSFTESGPDQPRPTDTTTNTIILTRKPNAP
jgi:hypothetical protein